jgi:Calx-beta domain
VPRNRLVPSSSRALRRLIPVAVVAGGLAAPAAASAADWNVDNQSATEGPGNQSMTFTVTRDTTAGAASIRWFVLPGTASTADYVAPFELPGSGDTNSGDGILQFADGENTRQLRVQLTDDALSEQRESLSVLLFGPSGASDTYGSRHGVGSIVDDELPASGSNFSPDGAVATTEGAPNVTIQVSRNDTMGAATVDYQVQGASASGGDFGAPADNDLDSGDGTLSFADGQSTLNVTIPITDDSSVEGEETFSLLLRDPSGGFTLSGSHTVIDLNDNDAGTPPAPPTVSVSDDSVTEDISDLWLTVTRSSGAGATIIPYEDLGVGSATFGQDYGALFDEDSNPNDGMLTFADGQTSLRIFVPIINDLVHEADEDVFVDLLEPFNATIADGQARGEILDDDDAPPPNPPTVTSVSPPSGSDNNTPRIFGSAPVGTTVQIHRNATCTNAVAGAVGSATTFATVGLPVTVGDNSSNSFYATAMDANGTSACSSTFVIYNEVTLAPPAMCKGINCLGPVDRKKVTDFFASMGKALGGMLDQLEKNLPPKPVTVAGDSPFAGLFKMDWSWLKNVKGKGARAAAAKQVVLGQAAVSVAQPGPFTATLTFNAGAVKALRKAGKANVTLRGSFTDPAGASIDTSSTHKFKRKKKRKK